MLDLCYFSLPLQVFNLCDILFLLCPSVKSVQIRTIKNSVFGHFVQCIFLTFMVVSHVKYIAITSSFTTQSLVPCTWLLTSSSGRNNKTFHRRNIWCGKCIKNSRIQSFLNVFFWRMENHLPDYPSLFIKGYCIQVFWINQSVNLTVGGTRAKIKYICLSITVLFTQNISVGKLGVWNFYFG